MGDQQGKTQKGRSLTAELIGGKRATLLKISLSLGRNPYQPTPLQADICKMPQRSDTF
ncbi:hypothetical protein [Marivita cryptomonadis]|uniref:hypothetical protein n=1 Tax=Marivita cryptomonadis TaxID=505252 RepID=UPI001939E152|nr:hypothetical protein [Marivita cryptomonadis]MBM2333810.1 hypothetical protein [Marivita cryptomonadis]